jgi:hypothetical protein
MGPLAAPGKYKVSMALSRDGVLTPVGETHTFVTSPLGTATMPLTDADRASLLEFQQKTGRLQRAVLGAVQVMREQQQRLGLIKKALSETPGADAKLFEEVRQFEDRLRRIQMALTGDTVVSRYNEPTPSSIVNRVQGIVSGHWTSTSAATQTHREAYRVAAEAFGPVLEQLRTLVDVDIKSLHDRLEAIGAPYTPGRVPRWKPE